MPAPKRSNLTPDYRYNPTARRYIDNNGRFVSAGTIRGALDDTLRASRGNIDLISGQLQRGEISLAQWQTSMAQEIKMSHMASAAAGKGGWAQMSQSDYGAAGQRIRAQYEYLNKFAQDIASGKQPLNGNFSRRARMYNDAARATFENAREREYTKGGATHAGRILAKADHCPDCLAWAFESAGWFTLAEFPAIGSSVCRTNCLCGVFYGRELPDGTIERMD